MSEQGVQKVVGAVVGAVKQTSTPMIVMVVLFVLLFWALYYMYSVATQKEYNCKVIGKIPSKIMLDIPDDVLSKQLNKVSVKTAYNCCCTGDFKNDFVEEEQVILIAKYIEKKKLLEFLLNKNISIYSKIEKIEKCNDLLKDDLKRNQNPYPPNLGLKKDFDEFLCS